MPDNNEDFVKGAGKNLFGVWAIVLGGISAFGICWLITWITNFREYRNLANTSGAGDWSPFIAFAITVVPLMILSAIRSRLND